MARVASLAQAGPQDMSEGVAEQSQLTGPCRISHEGPIHAPFPC
jgi:hypothetical protein